MRAVVVAVMVVCGCSTDDPAGEPASPTSTEGTSPPGPPPERSATLPAVPLAPARPPLGACPAVPAQTPPDPWRPSYTVDLRVSLEDNAVEGELTVRFRPDLATDHLVFRLWPNGPRPAGAGARLEVGDVSLDPGGPVAGEQPDPTTLVVPLESRLEPGDQVEATLAWRLTLPGSSNDRLSRQGDAVRLGSFFPLLAWEPGTGWATEPATAIFGESSTAPVADFSYSVAVPEGLSVLASGVAVDGRWEAVAMRDVALSIGRFRTASAVAFAPGPVEVTVGVDESLEDDPGDYLERVVPALEDLSDRFGHFPYPSYTLALTPGLSGGIEYPGHVMQGPGTLGRTTSHEVGHLWFFGLVGNNQGRDPWLDEGLATWAEARLEGNLDELVDRAVPVAAQGRLGEPMTYWERHEDAYFRGVYIQGAQALAAMGDPDLVDCALRLYVAANAFAIARAADLTAALGRVFPDAEETLAVYGVSP